MFKFLNTVEQKPSVQVNKPDFRVFASICMHRYMDPESVNSIIGLLRFQNPRFSFSKRRGDALIDRARSMEASRFLLKSDYEYMLFLDDDIIYDPMDVVALMKTMHQENLDIAGAAYPLKKEGGGQFTIKLIPGQPDIEFGKGKPICEVRMLATGFMAISRRVLEAMAKTMPLCSAGEFDFYPFFQPFPKKIGDKTYYLSEDWAFSERARDLGFKIWVDPSIKLGHAGRYVYDWDDFFRKPKEKRDEFVYHDPTDELK